MHLKALLNACVRHMMTGATKQNEGGSNDPVLYELPRFSRRSISPLTVLFDCVQWGAGARQCNNCNATPTPPATIGRRSSGARAARANRGRAHAPSRRLPLGAPAGTRAVWARRFQCQPLNARISRRLPLLFLNCSIASKCLATSSKVMKQK